MKEQNSGEVDWLRARCAELERALEDLLDCECRAGRSNGAVAVAARAALSGGGKEGA